MSDCQWLATLHAHGLLHSGFVPPPQIRRLQDYLRVREDHISMATSHVQHMQKAMERMNVKLHDTISDLTGVSGLKVVRAIVAGQRDPQQLLQLCDVQIRKKKAQRVMESLRGTWQAEHLFALRQALAGWDFYQAQIRECDQAIEQVLHELSGPPSDDDAATPSRAKPGGANTPRIEGLHRMLVQLCGGHDPTIMPGMGDHSLLCVIGEVGTIFGRHGVNIASFALGRGENGAIGVVNIDEDSDASTVLDAAVDELRRVPAIREVSIIRLT